MILVETHNLLSKVLLYKSLKQFVGESEKKLSTIFNEARENKPCIIFFDDLHIICDKKIVKFKINQNTDRE